MKLIVVVTVMTVSFMLAVLSAVPAINGNLECVCICLCSAAVFGLVGSHVEKHKKMYERMLDDMFPDD